MSSSKELFTAARIKGINNKHLNSRSNKLDDESSEFYDQERTGTTTITPHPFAVPLYIVFEGLEEWKDWLRTRNFKDRNEDHVAEFRNADRRFDLLKDPPRPQKVEYITIDNRFRAPYILLFGTEEEHGLDGKFIVHGDHPHDTSYIKSNDPHSIYSYSPSIGTAQQHGLEIIIDCMDTQNRDRLIDIFRNKRDKDLKLKTNVDPLPLVAEMYTVLWDSSFDWYRNGHRGSRHRDDLTDFGSFDGTERIESMEYILENNEPIHERVVLTDFSQLRQFSYSEREHKKTLQLMHLSRESLDTEEFRADVVRDLKLIGIPFMSNYERDLSEHRAIMLLEQQEEKRSNMMQNLDPSD